jgi:hypothetical protein
MRLGSARYQSRQENDNAPGRENVDVQQRYSENRYPYIEKRKDRVVKQDKAA